MKSATCLDGGNAGCDGISSDAANVYCMGHLFAYEVPADGLIVARRTIGVNANVVTAVVSLSTVVEVVIGDILAT